MELRLRCVDTNTEAEPGISNNPSSSLQATSREDAFEEASKQPVVRLTCHVHVKYMSA